MSSGLTSRICTVGLALVVAAGFASAASAQVTETAIECQYVTAGVDNGDITLQSDVTEGFNVFVTAITEGPVGGFPRQATGTADALINGNGDIVDGFFQAEVIVKLAPPIDNYICAVDAAVRGNGFIEIGDEAEGNGNGLDVLLRANSILDGQRRRFTSLDCIPGDDLWDGRACSVHPVFTDLRVSEQGAIGERLVIDRGRVSGSVLYALLEGDLPGPLDGIWLICECLFVGK